MKHTELIRRISALHPRALEAWTRDVGELPPEDGGAEIKIIAYAPPQGACIGHVQALPGHDLPGVAHKLLVENGSPRWEDISKPVDQISSKSGKSVSFKVEVKIVQLERMRGYRESQDRKAAQRQAERELVILEQMRADELAKDTRKLFAEMLARERRAGVYDGCHATVRRIVRIKKEVRKQRGICRRQRIMAQIKGWTRVGLENADHIAAGERLYARWAALMS